MAIKPEESRVIAVFAINAPPLEDIKEPFWEKHLKNVPDGDKKFLLCTIITSHVGLNVKADTWESQECDDLPFVIETPISFKQRPKKEMVLVRKWSENQTDFPGMGQFSKVGNIRLSHRMAKNTVIKDGKYSHWYFVRTGNRYPGDSDRPETWQGWKELEESLTPSTMRDEIRLTRILIQYCDTEDEAVLKELKDWFAGMNEIQRTVMAKCIRDRAISTYGEKLLPQFRELYKAIREHDVVPIPESNKQFLRELGLIE